MLQSLHSRFKSACVCYAVFRFESGSMPYAQLHYPFENKARFEANFPADFIAEGLDQTRGWFYTLMVISTCLFDKPPFKNLIVNGLVLAADGKKMSKRLKNYPAPDLILSRYGADALRLYLISSPVVRAEPLKFREEDVLGMIKRVFLPWINAFRFFQQGVARLSLEKQQAGGAPFMPSAAQARASTNVMDAWIQASLQNLIKFVHTEMAAYRLYTVTPRLLRFIEQLTNWYVRLNRSRLKGQEGDEEAAVGLSVLYDVLANMTVLMAPFTPFLTEFLYQRLRKLHPDFGKPGLPPDALGVSESVHYLHLPAYEEDRIDEAIETQMDTLTTVIELGRVIRERKNISLKTPVKEVIVVSKDASRLHHLDNVKKYVLAELNVWSVTTSSDVSQWSSWKVDMNHKVLGKRLGKERAAVAQAVAQLTPAQISEYAEKGSLVVAGHTLSGDDLILKKEFKGDASIYQAETSADGGLLVVLDTRQDDRVLAQGTCTARCYEKACSALTQGSPWTRSQ